MNDVVVKIEKMAFGGAGFGHLHGKACFVPFTAPGDIARIRIKKEKRSYLEGELLQLLESSERRITPLCPVFGACGGCNWQHLSYSDQLVAKEEIFAELLWRSGRVSHERILPIVPAPEPFAYRSRIQLKVRCIDGEPQLGFYRAGSHFVVNIPEKCAIVHPVINRLIIELRRVITTFPEKEKIPQIDVAIGGDGRAELVIHYIGSTNQEIIRHFQKYSNALRGAGMFLQTGNKATLEKISEEKGAHLTYKVPNYSFPELPEILLSFKSGGFSQVNYRQNLALVETVCCWAGATGRERVLDIFCGNGNFSLPLAGKASHVNGVEDYGPSITIARYNSEANGIKNVSFTCADAVSEISRMVAEDEKFEIILLDPPREGAPEVVRAIPALQPKAILYISCDPATLARDIGILKRLGYEVTKCRPVDMFPQTYHIESVTLLEPADKSGHT
jgi:23S rRNA (uracil1939-C5)-methyltransferase